MINMIKEKLLEEPIKIKELLELYDYHHINIRSAYISFGRSEDSSPKSLVIYLKDNDALIVKDHARNLTLDIFNLLIKQRGVDFKDVIKAAKKIVGIDDYYRPERTCKAFNGFYAKIKNRTKQELKTYDDSILNKYKPYGNLRFLKDGINLAAQRHFNIGYDVESQSITIPIYDEFGRLLGVKCRRNCDDCEQKYWFDVPCQESMTLYGYSQNYQYLEGETVIIVEAEKSVMQFYSMGYQNVVALGSSSISKKQCQMILSLNPKKVVFMMDRGLDFETIKKNMLALRTYGKMKEFIIQYWVPGADVPDKASPSDSGQYKLERALREELVTYEE